MKDNSSNNSFKDTLNLPRTDFSIRANALEKEAELLARWQKETLYEKTYESRGEEESFVLHDGPPYANGHIHMGTAFNKIIKDIVCKFQRMSGKHVPFKPGWDCHGLPIELKVTQELGLEKNKDAIDSTSLRKSCRSWAGKWIDIQRNEFKALGVLAQWDEPYITMSPEYEADTLRALARFNDRGYIERKGKTVAWCFACQTVLAAAEIEYQERKDPSCYIFFPLTQGASKAAFSSAPEQPAGLKVGLLVWTTTPWTIPLNRAVVLNPDASYVVLAGKNPDEAYIVGQDLADATCAALGIEKKVLHSFHSSDLKGKKAAHPFIEGLEVPILLDDMVTLKDGTACMHMAPGCGPEDYILAVKSGIEIFSPLSVDGKYSEGIEPAELKGMSILDGQIWVLKTLAGLGRLIHKTSIRHSYPHCWRCKNGLMFRATQQWFCDLDKHDLVENVLKEIDQITFIPQSGANRLRGTISSRNEWCISRQRYWGVPIPALTCTKCDHTTLSSTVVNALAAKVASSGIEAWESFDLRSLGSLLSCLSCGNHDSAHFEKGKDILDVWFDSGVSNYAVLHRNEELKVPADLYFEGSDQHRGWFQSSLLSSVILNDARCTQAIATHGYVVDAKGYKMSKSLGNVIAPGDVIARYSTDILRLWAASCDYEHDMVISDLQLKNVAQAYGKIRNTCRFLISNLYDFDITKDAIEVEHMLAIDQYVLTQLHILNKEVLELYENYHIAMVYQKLVNFCSQDLSAFYLDISKDRLYVESAHGHRRRSAQTAYYYILDTLTRLCAPILSFLAEEVSDHYMKGKKQSVHLEHFIPTFDVVERMRHALAGKRSGNVLFGSTRKAADGIMFAISSPGVWNGLFEVRGSVLKALERLREKGEIHHSLEAGVELCFDKKSEEGALVSDFLEGLEHEKGEHFLKDFFIVSQVRVHKDAKDLEQSELSWLSMCVVHASGVKCPRCWQWDDASDSSMLCHRCKEIIR